MVDQLQNIKLHIQSQAVHDPFQGITLVFSKTIHEQDQKIYNYLVAKFQNFNLQMQYMVNMLHVSNLLQLNKVTYQKILVSADLDLDLDTVQAITQVFSKPSANPW